MNLEETINYEVKRIKQDINDVEVIMKGEGGIIYNPMSISVRVYTKFGYQAVTELHDNIFNSMCKDYNLSREELWNRIKEYKLEK